MLQPESILPSCTVNAAAALYYTSYRRNPIHHHWPSHTLKPNPAMQLRYWAIVDWQSFCGLAAVEKSMQSSRFAFSSLHTQHGCCAIVSGIIVVGSDVSSAHLGLRGRIGGLGSRWRSGCAGAERCWTLPLVSRKHYTMRIWRSNTHQSRQLKSTSCKERPSPGGSKLSGKMGVMLSSGSVVVNCQVLICQSFKNLTPLNGKG